MPIRPSTTAGGAGTGLLLFEVSGLFGLLGLLGVFGLLGLSGLFGRGGVGSVEVGVLTVGLVAGACEEAPVSVPRSAVPSRRLGFVAAGLVVPDVDVNG